MTKTESIPALASVGIDIGNNAFHLIGFDSAGEVILHREIKRLGFEKVFEDLPRCIAGIEACLSAHFVGSGFAV